MMWKQNKHYEHILALDPSGDHTKGKGTTGICYMNTYNKYIEVFEIKAIDFKDKEAYWDKIIQTIVGYKTIYNDIVIVVEDYILYAEKAVEQSCSLLETPRLIGIIQWYCYAHDIPCYLEFASVVKNRWTLPILEHKGYLVKVGRSYTINGQVCSCHCIDALRHAIHYATFINKEHKK